MMKPTDALRNTKLAVTLIRSTIGRSPKQCKIVEALYLRKVNQTKVYPDGPIVWGMLEKVIHMVKIERIHHVDAKFVTKNENPLRPKLGFSRWPNTPYH